MSVAEVLVEGVGRLADLVAEFVDFLSWHGRKCAYLPQVIQDRVFFEATKKHEELTVGGPTL